jgi:hypothetical protein
MNTLLACVLVSSLFSAQEETVTSGNVVVRLPSGWKAEVKVEGLYLTPGDLREGQSYVVIVSPGGKADGNLAEGLEKSWKEFESGGKVTNRAPGRETKTSAGTEGLFSVGIMESKDGTRLIVSLAMFKPADRYEVVIALSAQDPIFAKYSGQLSELLKGLRFKNVELPVPTPAYDLFLTASTTTEPTAYTLFKDGSALALLPREGMDGFDLATAKKGTGARWGTHVTKEGTVDIRIGDEALGLKSQADGTWKRADGLEYLKAEPSTGLKLDGSYLMRGREDKPESSILLFKPDGTFEDRTIKPPLTGTYEIVSNTMKLKTSDERMKITSFVATPKSGSLLISGIWFVRLP